MIFLGRWSREKIVVVGCMALIFTFSTRGNSTSPVTVLSESTLSSGKTITTGNWGFTWKSFLGPEQLDSIIKTSSYIALDKPILWNELPQQLPAFGYGTYFTLLKIPPSLQGKDIGIYLPKCHTSCKVFVGQREITQAGIPAGHHTAYRPAYIPRKAHFVAQDTLIPLIIHVANFYYAAGGIYEPVYIGLSQHTESLAMMRLASALGVALALFVAAIFYTGIFNFIKKDRALLYFGLFCIAQSTRILFSTDYPYYNLMGEVDWKVVVRLEFSSLILSVIFFSQLVHAIFPQRASKTIIRIFQWISLVYLIYIFVGTPFMFSSINRIYVWLISLLALYGIWVFLKAFWHGDVGSRLAVTSLGFLMTLFILQILRYQRVIDYNPIWEHAFYGGFILSQSMLLSQRIGQYVTQLGQKALQGIKAKNQFLATLSHELHTPMNGVIGMTSLLESTPLTAEQKRYLRTIKESSNLMVLLLQDLLSFSNLENNTIKIEQKEFRLDMAIEDVVNLFEEKARTKNLLVHLRFAPGTPRKVLGDATHLKQALMHLVSNAIKFTEKGEVRISVQVRNKQSAHHAIFEIEILDTGIGIPKEQIKDIFIPFAQGDNAYTRKYQGTGLGLAITQRLVKAMGGTIKLDSTPNLGSRFTIQLPLQVSHSKHTPDPKLKGKKAAVFCGNPEVSQSIVLELQWQGVEVLSEIPEDVQGLVVFVGERWAVNNAHLIRKWQKAGCHIVQWSYGTSKNPNIKVHIVNPLLPSKVRKSFKQAIEDRDESTLQAPSSPKSFSEAHHISILIAEDNPINQKLALMLLRKMNFQPDAVNNGLEALEAMEKKHYDLIFMDLQMPQMDGITATQQIRTHWPEQEQPIIIALTANAMPEDKARCAQAGMNDFISKPIQPNMLEDKLRHWVHHILSRKSSKQIKL